MSTSVRFGEVAHTGGSEVALKVFISWSGEQSHALAAILHDWLPAVLHFVDPWMSSKDIAKGKRWGAEIGESLEQARFCIVCVTPGVGHEPWVNFEAGAVSKTIGDSYVCPLLLGVSPDDLGGLPLSQFQCTPFDKDGVGGLLRSINQAAGSPMPEARLDKSLDFSWAGLRLRAEAIDLHAREKLPSSDDVSNTDDNQGSDLLDSEAATILVSVADGDVFFHPPDVEEIAAHVSQTKLRTEYHLDRLVERGFLNQFADFDNPLTYEVTKTGRTYVVENNLDQ